MVGCKSKFGFGVCVCEMSEDERFVYHCDFADACNNDEEEILKECDQAELIS